MNDDPRHAERFLGGRRVDFDVEFENGTGIVGKKRTLRRPFRLGYGSDCDVRLEGGSGGPEVVFEVERAQGPLLVARAVPVEEFDRYVELRINGEPLRHPVQQIEPGSRLDVVDKSTDRRYSVVVHPRPAYLKPRYLALAIAVLALIGMGVGAYLYFSLRVTQEDISRTEARVTQAEADVADTEARVRESLTRIAAGEAELSRAIVELRALQDASERKIRLDFTDRLAEIDRQNREDLSRLAQEDTRGRAQLAERTRADVALLREEFSDRMVESYRDIKALETRMHESMAEQAAALAPPGERFKQILGTASRAVIFIRTDYEVELERSGETSTSRTLGTGFVVNDSGLAISAQHVLFPWRYDRQLLVLEEFGLARVLPESVRWSVWLAGVQVIENEADLASFDESTGYHADSSEKPVRLIHVREARLSPELVQAPIGVIEVPVPVPGPSDSAVLQVVDFAREFDYLPVPESLQDIEALDEVLAVGYPFSRLQSGRAVAQGVRGFVRRVIEGVLELNVPLHPGLSGGPILDLDGAVIGMAMATLGSDVYGMAVDSGELSDLLTEAREQVLEEEQRLADIGCNPGAIDGVFDVKTLSAYLCEESK